MPIAEDFSGVRTRSIAAFTAAILVVQSAAPAPAFGAWDNGWHRASVVTYDKTGLTTDNRP